MENRLGQWITIICKILPFCETDMRSIFPSMSYTHKTSVSLVHQWLLKKDITETGIAHCNGADDGDTEDKERWFS